MKVKVLVKFKDKHTKKIHKVNEVIDVTEERYCEILKKGKFVEPVEEPEASPVEEPEASPVETPEVIAPAQTRTKKKNKKDVE